MLEYKVARWLDNHIAPCNLMIDDLSDAYIDKYVQSRKNDWGYMIDEKDSSFNYLKERLLNQFPYVKITFFVPYLKHSVISDDTNLKIIKYGIGERKAFSVFLSSLVSMGHEIAHHGSTHGAYNCDGLWYQEWELFDDVESGVAVTFEGKKVFERNINYQLFGGKYCGYKYNKYSDDIVSESDFLYWCKDACFFEPLGSYSISEKNSVIDFPTTIPGNIFVKYKYKTENVKKDLIKRVISPFHSLFDLYNKIRIRRLIVSRSILSIQEHYSPSTTRGIVQSANIHSDMSSLLKIFNFLSKFDIWYATCADIAKYMYTEKNTTCKVIDAQLSVNYADPKKIGQSQITLIFNKPITPTDDSTKYISSKKMNSFIVTLILNPGKNNYSITYDK